MHSMLRAPQRTVRARGSNTPRPLSRLHLRVSGTQLLDLAAHFARVLTGSFAPLREQRAQGKPGARCTRGLACKMHKRMRTRAYRFSGGNPAFPAQWFYGLLRTLPGDQDLFVTVAPWMMAGPAPGWAGFASAGLDANLEASGPHDFTVRLKRCPSCAAKASTASRTQRS